MPADVAGMLDATLNGCPYCGRRLSNVTERDTTPAEKADKVFRTVRDRLYVLYEPVAVGLADCPRHGTIRIRRLRPVGPPCAPGRDGAAW